MRDGGNSSCVGWLGWIRIGLGLRLGSDTIKKNYSCPQFSRISAQGIGSLRCANKAISSPLWGEEHNQSRKRLTLFIRKKYPPPAPTIALVVSYLCALSRRSSPISCCSSRAESPAGTGSPRVRGRPLRLRTQNPANTVTRTEFI